MNVELKAGEAADGARRAIAEAGATDRCLLASARLAFRMAFGPYGGATGRGHGLGTALMRPMAATSRSILAGLSGML